MPFGYNPLWRTWKCPLCKGVFRFKLIDRFAREYATQFIAKHSKWHKENDPQKRLYSGPFLYGDVKREVLKKEMKIPPEAVEAPKAQSGLPFLKVSDLGLKLSQTLEFEIVGNVEEFGTGTSKVSYSCPVSYRNGQRGQYRLNKSTLRAFVPVLGDDTDRWLGAKFTAFCGMVNNPATGKQQLGLTVLVDSVKAPERKK